MDEIELYTPLKIYVEMLNPIESEVVCITALNFETFHQSPIIQEAVLFCKLDLTEG